MIVYLVKIISSYFIDLSCRKIAEVVDLTLRYNYFQIEQTQFLR